MSKSLRVLIIEDSEADALLVVEELERNGYRPSWRRVDTLEALRAALRKEPWDVVLSDHHTPPFNSRDSLRALKDLGLNLPFLIVSGAIGEEEAVEAMRAGAQDYVSKNRLNRLIPALERALDEAETRRKRQRAEEARRESERRFQTLARVSPVGIFRTDGGGNCVYVNERWCAIAGLEPMEALSAGWWQAVHPDDRERVKNDWKVSLDSGLAFQAEYRFQRTGGDCVWVLARAVIEKDAAGGVAGLVGTVTDITERKLAEERLERTTARLQQLSRRLLEVQEAERRHIARELHDEVGQALTATKINLQALQRFPDQTNLAQRLEDSVKLVDGVLQQVRHLSLDLRPSMLDDLGLAAALRWYVEQQARRSGLQAQFHADSMEERLDATLETACFRVAQEALTNTVRHARAKSISVELRALGVELHLVVRDDGVGFDAAVVRERVRRAVSFGLLGMEERVSLAGGRFVCSSAAGEGTEIRAVFPLIFQPAAQTPREEGGS